MPTAHGHWTSQLANVSIGLRRSGALFSAIQKALDSSNKVCDVKGLLSSPHQYVQISTPSLAVNSFESTENVVLWGSIVDPGRGQGEQFSKIGRCWSKWAYGSYIIKDGPFKALLAPTKGNFWIRLCSQKQPVILSDKPPLTFSCWVPGRGDWVWVFYLRS